jgi:hypothetical protein
VRLITENVLRNHRKRQFRKPVVGIDACDAFLDGLAEPNSELAHEWDLDHDRHLFQKLQTIVQPAAQVAAELGLTVNAVTLAKSRILKRLREEAGDLLK